MIYNNFCIEACVKLPKHYKSCLGLGAYNTAIGVRVTKSCLANMKDRFTGKQKLLTEFQNSAAFKTYHIIE